MPPSNSEKTVALMRRPPLSNRFVFCFLIGMERNISFLNLKRAMFKVGSYEMLFNTMTRYSYQIDHLHRWSNPIFINLPQVHNYHTNHEYLIFFTDTFGQSAVFFHIKVKGF